MNNSEREFAEMIKGIENELRDLKTAHQRPLGTLNFFRESSNFTVNIAAGNYAAVFDVVVTIEEPTVTPPIVQVGWEIPSGFYDVSVFDMTTSPDYSIWTYQLALLNNGAAETVAFKFGAVSAQPIKSITWSYH